MEATLDTAHRYVDEDRIATGGMASVWRSYDRETGREVAIKRLHPHIADEPAAVQRFEREIAIATSLQHAGIARVLDAGTSDSGPYMVMELIQGQTLRQRMNEAGPLPWTEAQRIAISVAMTLAHAHEQGILHRDIKPENIILEAGTGRVVLVDFGIASFPAFERRLTTDGNTMGTADYLSPERAMGAPGTAASDLYSLGVVFYEMVTGAKPFNGDNVVAVAVAHQTLPPPRPSQLAELPPTVEKVILRSLAKAPTDRFVTADQFVSAMTHASTATQELPEVRTGALRRWWNGFRQAHRGLVRSMGAAAGSLGTYVVAWLAF